MGDKVSKVKGTNDFLPEEAKKFIKLESLLHSIMSSFGYSFIKTPAFEKTELFVRSVGKDSDIVNKEMYTWLDNGKTSLTLKPEGTASVVRAFVQNNIGASSPINRLYYVDAFFRRERPQRGRFRQFHQLGIEAIGSENPEQDAEVIAVAYSLCSHLGLSNVVTKINSIGSSEARGSYSQALKEFLIPHADKLSETSRARLDSNPLRILDTKIPDEIELIKNAPVISDFLDDGDRKHFEDVLETMESLGLKYEVDPRLVRGLDYYNRTTFEMVSSDLGSQNAVLGGGRYDSLVKDLGGKPTPAIGFAAGIERLILCMDQANQSAPDKGPDVYICLAGDDAIKAGAPIAKQLRDSGLTVVQETLRRSIKSQLRDANRLGSRWAVIIGQDEVNANTVQLKSMDQGGDQSEIPSGDLLKRIRG
mgnify:CR=1 FL=1